MTVHGELCRPSCCTPSIPPARPLPHHLLSNLLWVLIASLALGESLLWLLKSLAEALLSLLHHSSPALPPPAPGASPFSALHAYPAPPSARPYTLVLDLDETLVHASPAFSPAADLRIEIMSKRHTKVLYVSKRPYLDVFLEVASRYFQIVVYTAGVRRYADAVLDSIDRQGVISKRFCRETCDVVDGSVSVGKKEQETLVIKDLTKVSKDLATTVFIDNSPEAYLMHRANGIAIAPWYDDPKDQELLRILPFLVALRSLKDVRSVLGRSPGKVLKVEEKFKVI